MVRVPALPLSWGTNGPGDLTSLLLGHQTGHLMLGWRELYRLLRFSKGKLSSGKGQLPSPHLWFHSPGRKWLPGVWSGGLPRRASRRYGRLQAGMCPGRRAGRVQSHRRNIHQVGTDLGGPRTHREQCPGQTDQDQRETRSRPVPTSVRGGWSCPRLGGTQVPGVDTQGCRACHKDGSHGDKGQRLLPHEAGPGVLQAPVGPAAAAEGGSPPALAPVIPPRSTGSRPITAWGHKDLSGHGRVTCLTNYTCFTSSPRGKVYSGLLNLRLHLPVHPHCQSDPEASVLFKRLTLLSFNDKNDSHKQKDF